MNVLHYFFLLLYNFIFVILKAKRNRDARAYAAKRPVYAKTSELLGIKAAITQWCGFASTVTSLASEPEKWLGGMC